MAHAPDFADLEILIRQRTDRGYPVRLVLNMVRSSNAACDGAAMPTNQKAGALGAGSLAIGGEGGI